ncbi:MAG: TIGR01777 family oxidoreductase [Anaerolineae bacterium]
MNRVIITGGTGLIGSALAADLAIAGYDVVLLTRNPDRARAYRQGIRAAAWDGRTGEGWGDLANGAFAIVNLAGETIGPMPWYLSNRKERILASRVNAGRAVVDAVSRVENKPRVVVQASAIGYYGSRGEELLAEDAGPGSDYLSKVCVEWENSTATVEVQGVRRVIIRTGLLLDRQADFLRLTALPFQLYAGGPLGNGRQWWSWLHMADEIGAIRFLLETEAARGPYNLAAPNPVTNREFGRVLARVLGRPSYFPTPALALKLVLGEVADELIFASQRAASNRLQACGYRFQFTDLELALRNIYGNP